MLNQQNKKKIAFDRFTKKKIWNDLVNFLWGGGD